LNFQEGLRPELLGDILGTNSGLLRVLIQLANIERTGRSSIDKIARKVKLSLYLYEKEENNV